MQFSLPSNNFFFRFLIHIVLNFSFATTTTEEAQDFCHQQQQKNTKILININATIQSLIHYW